MILPGRQDLLDTAFSGLHAALGTNAVFHGTVRDPVSCRNAVKGALALYVFRRPRCHSRTAFPFGDQDNLEEGSARKPHADISLRQNQRTHLPQEVTKPMLDPTPRPAPPRPRHLCKIFVLKCVLLGAAPADLRFGHGGRPDNAIFSDPVMGLTSVIPISNRWVEGNKESMFYQCIFGLA